MRAALLLVALSQVPAIAQERIGVQSDVLFFGDNTEFSNPFREGETIFGAAMRVAAVIDIDDRTRLSLGAFGNQRFGSENGFELVRPVIALTVRGRRSSFVFGTMPAYEVDRPSGPDRGGPHGLLPPLQREVLSFERPYEAGLLWTFSGAAITNRFWLDWQRLNTPEHRERFDGGFNALLRASKTLAVPVQLHVVHEGGQLHSTGEVADSAAAAAGLRVSGPIGGLQSSVEVLGLVSRDVRDRSRSDSKIDGTAVFGRAEAHRAGWRGHIIVWRGRNFIKDEGDGNYLSVRRNGDRYRGTRDYAELGLTRRFALAPGAMLEASARVHRIENHYEYSYRIMSVLSARWNVH